MTGVLTRAQAAELVARNPGVAVSLRGQIARVVWVEGLGPVPRPIRPISRREAS